MGSFANSFHVRSDDATAVLAAIATWLRTEGYVPGPEPARLTPPDRGIYVADAVGGWVSVLDSDLGESWGLAANVAAEMKTTVLAVMVNDSDSWHYQLFECGNLTDEFDSVDEDGDEVEGQVGDLVRLAELLTLVRSGNQAEIQRVMGDRIQQMQADLESKMPPDILKIYRRVQAGQATPDENRKYALWVQSNMTQLMPQPKSGVGGLLAGLSLAKPKPRKRKPPREHPHLKYLRPLLKEEVMDRQVEEALARQSTFAEEDLANVLPLLGIPAL